MTDLIDSSHAPLGQASPEGSYTPGAPTGTPLGPPPGPRYATVPPPDGGPERPGRPRRRSLIAAVAITALCSSALGAGAAVVATRDDSSVDAPAASATNDAPATASPDGPLD